MGLLNQLFRHKGDIADVGAAFEPATPSLRGLGAIAAAVGARDEHGVPAAFELSLGDLLARVPEEFVWPGMHDTHRVLHLPAAEIAPEIARGRAEIPLTRLVALAPEVFRWERSGSEPPRIRLNLQKLLDQIGKPPSSPTPPVAVHTVRPPDEARKPAPPEATAAHLPAIVFDKGLPTAKSFPPMESLHRTTVEPAPAKPAVHVARAAITPVIPGLAQTVSGSQIALSMELRPQRDVGPAPVLQPACPAVAAAPPRRGESSDAPIPAPEAADVTNPPAAGAAPMAGPNFTALQSLFMTDASLDIVGVVAKAAALPGIHAVHVSGVAGAAQAGHVPASLDAKTLRDLADDFAAKPGIGSHTRPDSDIVRREDCAVAMFALRGVRLTAVLDARGFVAGVRERLARATAYLAGAPSVE